jgi:5-methylcytosine-specific restriction protein B
MSIPKNKTNEHINRAINQISIDEIPKGRLSNTYFLISGEKRLPPKYVLGKANIYANNEILNSNSFNAAEAVAFLRKLNYEI